MEGEYKVMWLEDKMAQALLGKSIGDEVTFESRLRAGEMSSCVITEIEE